MRMCSDTRRAREKKMRKRKELTFSPNIIKIAKSPLPHFNSILGHLEKKQGYLT